MNLQMGLDDENEAIAINLLPLLAQSKEKQTATEDK